MKNIFRLERVVYDSSIVMMSGLDKIVKTLVDKSYKTLKGLKRKLLILMKY